MSTSNKTVAEIWFELHEYMILIPFLMIFTTRALANADANFTLVTKQRSYNKRKLVKPVTSSKCFEFFRNETCF